MVSDSYNKRQSFYLEGIYFASFSTWDISPHLRYHRRNQHRNLDIDWILFLLNLLGWHWLIRLYRFQCTFLWYMFCMLHCVPTTQSQILCCHHIFDPLYSLLPPTPLPSGKYHITVCVYKGFFCSFVAFSLCPTYEWNHMVVNLFYRTYFTSRWYSQDLSILLRMAVFHLFSWLSSVPLYICTTSLSNLSKDSLVISMLWPPWIMLQWI